MSVTELFKEKPKKFGCEYLFDDNGEVRGVSHPEWPFSIRIDRYTGDDVAFVCKDTGDAFGEMSKDQFNTILICWLLVIDPELIDRASSYEAKET